MQKDIRLEDPLETLRRETLEKIKQQEMKKQRLCSHSWIKLTWKTSVCYQCHKVILRN